MLNWIHIMNMTSDGNCHPSISCIEKLRELGIGIKQNINQPVKNWKLYIM